jgi:hypothetical protein
MDDVAKGTERGLSRALQFVERADNPRSMQAAASAVKTLMSSWMVASGIENSTTARAQSASVFQINFASMPTRVPKQVEPIVETIQAPSVSADDFDEAVPL